MNLIQRRYNPERVTELATESRSSGGQSNELLLELIAGLPDGEAMEAVSERPRYWSDAMMNQLMDTFEEEAPRSGAVETGTGTAGGDAGLVPSPELGTTGGGLATETAGATTEGEATMDLETDGGGGGLATEDRPALDTLTGTTEEETASTDSGASSGGASTSSSSGGGGTSTGGGHEDDVAAADARPEIKSVWTRSTTPMFDETANIHFNAADRYWEDLSWQWEVSGAHSDRGVDAGPTTWLTVGVNIPEAGMVAGDTFTVTATVQDPQGNSATGHLDLEVAGIQMKTWEVFFDNEDAQTSERVDLVGTRRAAEEAARRASDPLIFDLDMDGLLGTATGESLANGQMDGETVLFDIDPERSSWAFVSSSDVPGLDAPAIPNGRVVYDNGDTENIGSNGRWDPQRSGSGWAHQRGELYSAGNEWIAEWVAVDDDQYDYFWGNRMDVERTEWLQKGTGDGFLVWDHNGNGVIDDNTEMMSEYDVDGNFAFANGYEKLRHYFDKDEDGVLKGAELSELMFWVDSNADAQTDTGELVPLSDYGITQIEIPVEGELASEATVGMANKNIQSEEAKFENTPG